MSKNKKSKIKKFSSIVFIMVFSFLILGGIALASYKYVTRANDISSESNSENDDGTDTKGNEDKDGNIITDFFTKNKKSKTNVAVFGVDKDGTRTDVIFVASFNHDTKKIDIISIPRDTRITLDEESLNEIREVNRTTPRSGTMKINAVSAYAHKFEKDSSLYTVKTIENILGIDIDYYIRMNLDGFRNIVDEIAGEKGLKIYVPQNMNYEDKAQDLYIHLKKGEQYLTGAQAEQLVRFRHYPNGDLGRVDVQQRFLNAMFDALMSKETILNLPNIVMTLYKEIDTNFGLDDMLKYCKYIDDIKAENIDMYKLPGESRYIGPVSYFIYDEDETSDLVKEIFMNQKDEEVIDSKKYSIQILNGSGINGLAGKTKDKLLEYEYRVDNIGDYDSIIKNTKIVVSKSGLGEDLLDYFNDAEIEVDKSSLDEGIDIMIILGANER